nr:hypothetical protein [Tanacetum cinerariifolium]
MTSGQISSRLDLTYAPLTIIMQQPSEGELDLMFEAMYDDYIGDQPSATGRTISPAQEPQIHQTSTASTSIADTAPTPTNSSSLATNIPITSQDVDELNSHAMVDGNTFVNPFANSSTSVAASSSSQNVDPSNMHTFYQPYPHEFQWTKDHPLEQNVKEAMTNPAWIDSMQEELLYLKRLKSKYVLEIPNKYGMESCDPIDTPMLIKEKLDLDQNGTPAKPTEKHLKEVKRIFRYLQGTINTGLWYTKDSGFVLIGFSDADYAGCKGTFKSTSSGA